MSTTVRPRRAGTGIRSARDSANQWRAANGPLGFHHSPAIRSYCLGSFRAVFARGILEPPPATLALLPDPSGSRVATPAPRSGVGESPGLPAVLAQQHEARD